MLTWFNKFKDPLSIILFPAIGWVYYISSTLSEQGRELAQFDIVAAKVTSNSERIVRIEGKIDAANDILVTLKEDIHDMRNSK